MSLRQIAENDLAITLEDGVNGFGWPITVTDPAGLSAPLSGQSQDIAQLIDPDTGQAVSGRLASVTLRISSLTLAGFTSLPRNIEDESLKPWLVAFDDINGSPYIFRVQDSNPDRELGLVTCLLETWQP